jgi:PAS domain S-box-containing protein
MRTVDGARNFPFSDGAMADRVRAHDWSNTPLGPIETWPLALRLHVDAALANRFPAAIFWGPRHVIIYNDAYVPVLGEKSDALGSSLSDLWPEIWDEISPILERAYQGEAQFVEDVRLVLMRNHHPETAYFTFCYSPLRDEGGAIAGVLATIVETTQKVRADAELRESRERLWSLFEQASTFMAFMRGPEHVFEYANPAFFQLVGGREVLGRTVRDAFPDAAGQGFFELMDEVYRSGKPYKADGSKIALQRTPDAGVETRYMDLLYQPVFDGKGQVSGIFAEGVDVTDRAVAEEALRASQKELQALADAIPQQIWMATPDGRIAYASAYTMEYTGGAHIVDGVVTWARLIHSEDLQRTREGWLRAVATGEPYSVEHRVRNAHGHYCWNLTRARPLRDETGQIIRWYGTTTEIEALKASQREAQTAREYLDLMVSSAAEFAIVSFSPSGEIVSWSSGAEHIFGYSAHEALGRHMDIMFTPDDRENGAPAFEMTRAGLDGRALDERWHIRKNGERFYGSGVTTAMRGDDGELHGFVKIARDISHQKQAEQELIDARNAAEAANIAKSEFLANMSHEIRTPMNAIVGLSNLLGRSGDLTPKQEKFVSTLQTSANTLLALINDLLDVAKIEASKTELEHLPFNLAQVMHEVSEIVSERVREKGLSFTMAGECVRDRQFIGDPNRLRQVIMNLCSNAVKFTDTGGVHVDIGCRPGDIPNTQLVSITVSDTGIGIAPEKIEKIFDKFVQADSSITRRYGGTGLGLAITRTLVEIMDGTISVDSVEGQGSRFTICLPLRNASNEEVATANHSLPAARDEMTVKHAGKVLLVEDHPANVMVAMAYLDQFGYAADIAETGVEAVEKVKSGHYTAILMDVQMPGMNGYDATEHIREHEKRSGKPHTPIIGMTAHAMTGDRERCLAAGMDDYISKPFEPEDLREILGNALAVP